MADADINVVTFSFEKLDAYVYSRDLVKEIYKLQKNFPKEEVYALGDQVRRAAASITANIAEGCGRSSAKEKIHFIEIAFGSLTESFSELQIAQDLGYITEDELNNLRPRFSHVARILSGLRKTLADSLTPKP
jgi:four helix bundle protein